MSQESFPAALKNNSEKAVSSNEPISGNPCKTPIQLLQEYGTKCGKPPVYTLEKAEGQAHHPSFTFKISIGDISSIGEGPSKKIAKHKAAECALNLLRGDPSVLLPTTEHRIARKQQPSQLQDNPIGTLQELTLQKRWRLPEYYVTPGAESSPKNVFTISCKVENLVETGSGPSKKVAKRIAAEKILSKLKSIPPDKINTSLGKVIGNNPGCTWESLKNSSGDNINLLKRSPLSIPNTDYVKMLGDIADEQGFHVTYLDIEELSVNGQYQCLAELSTNPVAVCHGTGISCGNAHNDAAHSALQYLKIMAGRK